jgi:hypothetical protein
MGVLLVMVLNFRVQARPYLEPREDDRLSAEASRTLVV